MRKYTTARAQKWRFFQKQEKGEARTIKRCRQTSSRAAHVPTGTPIIRDLVRFIRSQTTCASSEARPSCAYRVGVRSECPRPSSANANDDANRRTLNPRLVGSMVPQRAPKWADTLCVSLDRPQEWEVSFTIKRGIGPVRVHKRQ